MKKFKWKSDAFSFATVLLILIGIPVGIWGYDAHVWRTKIPAGAKVITMTANAKLGWLIGDVAAFNVITQYGEKRLTPGPVVEVQKGDVVVFKLTSSDVIHGFSLKDFGIFIEDGVRPGKVTLAVFEADKAGVFTFSCNIICGDEHKDMSGTLIVKA